MMRGAPKVTVKPFFWGNNDPHVFTGLRGGPEKTTVCHPSTSPWSNGEVALLSRSRSESEEIVTESFLIPPPFRHPKNNNNNNRRKTWHVNLISLRTKFQKIQTKKTRKTIFLVCKPPVKPTRISVKVKRLKKSGSDPIYSFLFWVPGVSIR